MFIQITGTLRKVDQKELFWHMCTIENPYFSYAVVVPRQAYKVKSVTLYVTSVDMCTYGFTSHIYNTIFSTIYNDPKVKASPTQILLELQEDRELQKAVEQERERKSYNFFNEPRRRLQSMGFSLIESTEIIDRMGKENPIGTMGKEEYEELLFRKALQDQIKHGK